MFCASENRTVLHFLKKPPLGEQEIAFSKIFFSCPKSTHPRGLFQKVNTVRFSEADLWFKKKDVSLQERRFFSPTRRKKRADKEHVEHWRRSNSSKCRCDPSPENLRWARVLGDQCDDRRRRGQRSSARRPRRVCTVLNSKAISDETARAVKKEGELSAAVGEETSRALSKEASWKLP